MPLVTIAIPFFDEELALPSAIRSVFAQTFADWELLLVDDGSRDRSRVIAESVRDPRVRVIGDGARKRLPARLNQIVASARGDLVARMDADDVMHPTRLARELETMRADASLDAVSTWVAIKAGGVAPTVSEISLPKNSRDVLVRGALAHATLLARRSFLQRFPYDEALHRAEDRDFFCRAFGVGRFAVVEEPLYVIRPKRNADDVVRDYVESMRQNRIIYMRHGLRMAGALSTARAVGGSFARELAYRMAGRAGAVNALIRRRGRPSRPHEARLVDEALAAARTTLVPGLDAAAAGEMRIDRS
jgi:glycosyltransferase involved in cell wall biosynthesis